MEILNHPYQPHVEQQNVVRTVESPITKLRSSTDRGTSFKEVLSAPSNDLRSWMSPSRSLRRLRREFTTLYSRSRFRYGVLLLWRILPTPQAVLPWLNLISMHPLLLSLTSTASLMSILHSYLPLKKRRALRMLGCLLQSWIMTIKVYSLPSHLLWIIRMLLRALVPRCKLVHLFPEWLLQPLRVLCSRLMRTSVLNGSIVHLPPSSTMVLRPRGLRPLLLTRMDLSSECMFNSEMCASSSTSLPGNIPSQGGLGSRHQEDDTILSFV